MAARKEVLEIGDREVTITNPDKVFFPKTGHTKLDLVRYYLATADGALRGVRGRPMALKRYVQTAWPDFDWEAAYRLFFAEYSQCCTVEQLAGTRALEMAARCVVETGTATFYRMLSDLSREPVLKRLAAEISADEVRHYKHFYRYFQRYRSVEQPSRVSILRALLNRAAEVESEDAFYAFKAVFSVCNPGIEFHKSDYVAYRDSAMQLTKSHFPHGMAVKMLLKPLGLNPVVGRAMLPAITSAMRLFMSSWGGRATTKGRSFLSGA